MVHGNFLGAAIVAVIYTVYILANPGVVKSRTVLVLVLVILNALTIVLMSRRSSDEDVDANRSLRTALAGQKRDTASLEACEAAPNVEVCGSNRTERGPSAFSGGPINLVRIRVLSSRRTRSRR